MNQQGNFILDEANRFSAWWMSQPEERDCVLAAMDQNAKSEVVVCALEIIKDRSFYHLLPLIWNIVILDDGIDPILVKTFIPFF